MASDIAGLVLLVLVGLKEVHRCDWSWQKRVGTEDQLDSLPLAADFEMSVNHYEDPDLRLVESRIEV